MKSVRPGEDGIVDMGTMMKPPEQIYIATVTHPKTGDTITTAHRSLETAKVRVESYANGWEGEDRDKVTGNIEQVPLLP